jgi:hypothetical protein
VKSGKAAFCVIPTLWCSEEGKTVETVKGSEGGVGVGGEDEEVEHRGFLR